MKKYRLLKDCLDLVKGEEFFIEKRDYKYDYVYINRVVDCKRVMVTNQILEEWFEEIDEVEEEKTHEVDRDSLRDTGFTDTETGEKIREGDTVEIDESTYIVEWDDLTKGGWRLGYGNGSYAMYNCRPMKIVKDKPVDQAKPRVNKEVNEKMQKLREKKVDPLLWKPKVGDRNQWFDSVGDMITGYWCNDDMDKYRLSIGAVYKTFDEGQRAQDRQKAIVKVNRYIAEKNDGEKGNYDIIYSYETNKFLLQSHARGLGYASVINSIAFNYLQELEDKFEDELKLIFGVK